LTIALHCKVRGKSKVSFGGREKLKDFGNVTFGHLCHFTVHDLMVDVRLKLFELIRRSLGNVSVFGFHGCRCCFFWRAANDAGNDIDHCAVRAANMDVLSRAEEACSKSARLLGENSNGDENLTSHSPLGVSPRLLSFLLRVPLRCLESLEPWVVDHVVFRNKICDFVRPRRLKTSPEKKKNISLGWQGPTRLHSRISHAVTHSLSEICTKFKAVG
jgi:hypothetical protein